MSEPFIGEIRMVGFNFAPRNWANCDGQLLPIAQNTALFSLLGTMYGGDGRTNFSLPDLRGRVAIHTGTGPGLSPRPQGSRGGQETGALTAAQLPSHDHDLNAKAAAADTQVPTNNVLADTRLDAYLAGTTTDVKFAAGSVSGGGGNQAHNNVQPFLTIRFVIALNGLFPSRN